MNDQATLLNCFFFHGIVMYTIKCMFGQYLKVVAPYKTGEMLYKIAQKDYELKKI